MSTAAAPRVDADRIAADIFALASITDPERPFTRRSFTPRFLEGRAFLAERFAEAGLAVRIDTTGNLLGRRAGADPAARTIMAGSHSDTVPSGGRFDGIAGIVAALEVARALGEAGAALRHAYEVADFLAEEPSEYGLSCMGSRGMAGRLDAAMLDNAGPGGERLGAALARVGGDEDRLGEARRHDVAAFFELHIEQGRVLEAGRTALGIVTSIVGITRIEIVFAGRADHAGTTPMDLRHDALVPAAAIVAAVARLARERAGPGRPHFVATVGALDLAPNAANVVPGRVRLVVDARAEEPGAMPGFVAALGAEAQAAASAAGVACTLRVLSQTQPTACDSRLRSMLAANADKRGLSHVDIASGAGHDAAFIAAIAPAAMVFVPSAGGRSHAPEEWSDPETIAEGAAVMLGAILDFDAAPGT